MDSPLISVIVPVYNVAAHVGAAVESLLAQDHTRFEAVVVDDGSTDGSGEIASAAWGDDPRFRLIRRENGGLSAARNSGLETISGDYVAFLDSDDRYAPTYLSRLLETLEANGADWAACAIRYVQPDGSGGTHSAIHGAPKLDEHTLKRHALNDWREIIRHFPSAWNKLYRRSLIDGLRFDEGTWFEDHAWFYRIANRTDHLLHVPEPLYLQTQGRPGQITHNGGERVFEQFPVLDTMRDLMEASDKPGAQEAFQRIATRLIHERSPQVTDPARRARFLAQTRDYFTTNRLTYTPDWDPAISRALGLTLAGELPVSVIVPADPQVDFQALTDTRTSLEHQRLKDFEVIETTEADTHTNRNTGLAQAKGRFVVFLDAGDTLAPWALNAWVEAMLRHGTDMGASAFGLGLTGGKTHSGLHGASPATDGPTPLPMTPELAETLHAHPSAKIFRRAHLMAHAITFPPGPLSSWDVTLRAGQATDRLLYIPTPGARIALRPETRRHWRSAPDFPTLLAALQTLPPVENPHRLMARALWEKLNYGVFETNHARETFLATARTHLAAHPPMPPETNLDPYIGPRIRALLGLA